VLCHASLSVRRADRYAGKHGFRLAAAAFGGAYPFAGLRLASRQATLANLHAYGFLEIASNRKQQGAYRTQETENDERCSIAASAGIDELRPLLGRRLVCATPHVIEQQFAEFDTYNW